MKIIRIFADQLFAFKYKNEADNELRRLKDNDVFDADSFYEFLKEQS